MRTSPEGRTFRNWHGNRRSSYAFYIGPMRVNANNYREVIFIAYSIEILRGDGRPFA